MIDSCLVVGACLATSARWYYSVIMVIIVHCQQVLIAESYGGRDEPVDTLINNFVGVGVEPVFDPVRVKEVPDEKAYQVCPTCCNHGYALIYRVCVCFCIAQEVQCGKQNLVHAMCCSCDQCCDFAWHTCCHHKRCKACVWTASRIHVLLTACDGKGCWAGSIISTSRFSQEKQKEKQTFGDLIGH